MKERCTVSQSVNSEASLSDFDQLLPKFPTYLKTAGNPETSTIFPVGRIEWVIIFENIFIWENSSFN